MTTTRLSVDRQADVIERWFAEFGTTLTDVRSYRIQIEGLSSIIDYWDALSDEFSDTSFWFEVGESIRRWKKLRSALHSRVAELLRAQA